VPDLLPILFLLYCSSKYIFKFHLYGTKVEQPEEPGNGKITVSVVKIKANS
jgi:hypothetical protein